MTNLLKFGYLEAAIDHVSTLLHERLYGRQAFLR